MMGCSSGVGLPNVIVQFWHSVRLTFQQSVEQQFRVNAAWVELIVGQPCAGTEDLRLTGAARCCMTACYGSFVNASVST